MPRSRSTEHELTTALSYVHLYQRHDSIPVPSTTNAGTCTDRLNAEAVWRDDAWTEEDQKNASARLRKHQERCNRITQPSGDERGWNHFYGQHGVSFFNDRHYLAKAFPEEFCHTLQNKSHRTLVELGCGVGNNILPLLEEDHSADEWEAIWGLDLSAVAIDLLQQDARFQRERHRAHARVWDISKTVSSSHLAWFGIANVTTLLFCLSALAPCDFHVAAHNVIRTLKPGGTLLFRDYGRFDEAQLKLGTSRGKRLGDNYYRKHDGTTCYYFTVQDLERLFGSCLEILELRYIRRVYQNRAHQQERRRVWIQGRFRKPVESDG